MRLETLSPRMRMLAPYALVLLGAAKSVAAYLQALEYPFIFDDTTYVVNNNKLAGLRFTELWHLFAEPYNSMGEFLPLRELSYWLDISLFGLNPTAFRLHNIILYLLCLPLVYGCTLKIWRYFHQADAASAPWIAASVTALFALHPSHAEAVVWIAGRKDLLSGLLSLLALWLALAAKRDQGISMPHAVAALVILMAAMLSKATAVALGPIIAIFWVFFWRDMREPAKHRSQLLWPLAALILVLCVALYFASIATARVPFYFGIEAVTRFLALLGWFARLAISPESRHFFYPVFEDPNLPVMVAFGIAVLLAVTAGAVMILRKRSLAGLALLVFMLILLPSMQLIPYAPPSLVSDRFIFLAVWPAILLLVSMLWNLKPWLRLLLLFCFAFSWGFQTSERPRDWRSFEELLDTDLRVFPGHYMPALHKIKVFQVPDGQYQDALSTASNITVPEVRNVMVKLIKSYAATMESISTGETQEAMEHLLDLGSDLKQPPAQIKWNTPVRNFWNESQDMHANLMESLVKFFPDDALVSYNVGLQMLQDRRYHQTAVIYLRRAAISQHLPENARGSAFKNLGLALMSTGSMDEAEESFRTALLQSPPDLQANCLLADLYKQTGRMGEFAHAEVTCRGDVQEDGVLQ